MVFIVFSFEQASWHVEKPISRKIKAQDSWIGIKTVFWSLHSSFVARYETAVAAYFDEVDQFWVTKGKYFWKEVYEDDHYS